MTGYKSKKDAALDEEGMYLVHHTKRKDDDIQVYKKPWVDLTDEDCKGMSAGDRVVAMWANRILKEKNS